MRARGLLPALVVAMAIVAAPGVALAEDGTPPVGTLEIEGGVGYTHDRSLVLDVPATDDVGVETVLVGLLGGEMTPFAYQPRIEWSIPDGVGEQQLNIAVWWRDAAGNTSTAAETVLFDGTPPSFSIFKETTSSFGPPGTIALYVGGDDPESGVRAVRFSTDGGAGWGDEIAMTDQIVFWDPRDPEVGGKPNGLGPVTVQAKIRDGAFNWSAVRSTTIEYRATVEIGVSSNPTTGQSITFTPEWSSPVAFPAGTYCSWEFMTGNERALFSGEHDESYSYNQTQGAKSGGWCGPWTFTLPWSPVRQYLVAYRVMLPGGSEVNAELGAPGVRAFTSSVGSTSRAIPSSNLPLFYILPDDEPMTVGVPTTWRGFAVGGASIKSTDRWMVVPSTDFHAGASTFTFTPTKAGHVSVCLARGAGSTPMGQLTACFDPTVGRASGTGATPGLSSAPTGAGPTETAPTGTAAPSGGVSETPSAVAVASAGPGVTNEPPAAPNAGATSSSPSPAVPWALVGLAVVVLGGGATLLLRPGIRATVRSRFRR